MIVNRSSTRTTVTKPEKNHHESTIGHGEVMKSVERLPDRKFYENRSKIDPIPRIARLSNTSEEIKSLNSTEDERKKLEKEFNATKERSVMILSSQHS